MCAFLGLLFLLGASPAVLPPAWPEDLAGIRQAAATIATLQASFVQTRTLSTLKKPLASRGTISFRRPNDLRWEYQSPLATLLVVRAGNAQRLLKHGAEWVSDASAKLEVMTVMLDEMMLWLDGNFGASRTFRPRLRPSTHEQPARVDLIPFSPSLAKIIARITVTFGERPGTIISIDIFDQGEGVTHITFENPRYNEVVPDQRFDTPR